LSPSSRVIAWKVAEVYKHIYTHPASHPSLTREGLKKPGIIKIQGGVSKKRGTISIPCLYLCNYPLQEGEGFAGSKSPPERRFRGVYSW